MKCKKCGKKIDELEKYCDDCKSLLKKEKELNKLIKENKELNKLEITKEVDTLKNFKNIKKEDTAYLKEELKDIVNIEEEEFAINDDKKRTIIVILVVVGILIISLISILFIFKPEEKELEEEKINYKEILDEYGNSLKDSISTYLKENKEIPSWPVINNYFSYDKHIVDCKIHNIYKDGNIYLNDCMIDKVSIDFVYGKEQQTEGKKINIYKENKESGTAIYTDKETKELVSTITCITDDCKYISAYDSYVLVFENDKYYLYNSTTSSVEFGPFNILDNNYENNVLVYENKVYGILYEEDNKKNIYNIEKEKILKNIEGTLLDPAIKYNPRVMYKYGYAIFKNSEEYDFVNLKTGNVSYSITGTLNSFIENGTNNLVYITTYNSLNSKITIYNSNGKKMFDGKEFNDMRLINGNILVMDDTNFYIYDSSLKLNMTSNIYNNVLGIYDDFVVVVNNNNLELVDLEDNILATYDLEWKSSYKFNYILSGKFEENGKDIIYLIIEDENKTLKYYYNPSTKEFGKK